MHCRARDNPCEESGTFDASGAFHGDERHRSKDADGDGNARSNADFEGYGSHNDRGIYAYSRLLFLWGFVIVGISKTFILEFYLT